MSIEIYRELLKETVKFLYSMSVAPGRGSDGKLLSKIEAAISGDDAGPASALVSFNPNEKQTCPLCKAPDFNECGCPADEQMAAMI